MYPLTRSTFRTALLAAVCLAVVIAGCAKEVGLDGLGGTVSSAPEGAARASVDPSESDSSSATAATARKLIRNAYLTLEVSSTEQASAQLRAVVIAAGGYVGNESQTEDGYGSQQVSLTCRVPAEKLDDLLEQAQGQGKVESLQVSAEDITEQYFDLEIRLGTQQQLETRLLELLDRPSNKLADLLEIERELARVRGQIDQMEGRRRFWDHQVGMATLQLELHEPRPAIAGYEGGVLRTLGDAFRDAADNFVSALAFVISATGALVPVGAAVIFLVWIVLRWRSRWRRGKTKAVD